MRSATPNAGGNHASILRRRLGRPWLCSKSATAFVTLSPADARSGYGMRAMRGDSRLKVS